MNYDLKDIEILNKLKAEGLLLKELREEDFESIKCDNGYIFFNWKVENLRVTDVQITEKMFELISKLDSLMYLFLDNCNIESVPESLSNLTKLKQLGLENNKITKLPNLFKMHDLFGLYLQKNNLGLYIEDTINKITKLKKIEFLSLDNNNIDRLPAELGNLIELDGLNLDNNNIKKIPKTFLNLKKLTEFNLENNPIAANLPKEADGLSGIELIIFLLSLQHSESQQLNEAKILVLGDERVGKTSIINRVVDNSFEINQMTTEGIDIQNHYLSNGIKVNIWDFAGQEITHQTHQFFLSTRSLYLLVLDAQKEDNDSAIYDWLENIKSNAGNSPVIVVINKIDLNEGYRFDINRYKKDFPNIVDVEYTSAQENINIDKLIKSIERDILELGHINDIIPENWFAVKKSLEKLSDENADYIEGGEFDKICLDHSVEIESKQQTLLTILHEIGTVVRYENSRLNSVQIINPIWITNAVYKIIRSEFLNSNAILHKDKFSKIFKDENQYKERHYQWIMDLLVQFELAFRLNENEILIPSKLPNNEPSFDLIRFQNGLNLRYKYSGRLKKSVISQFIVKMSRYISKKEKTPYWKRGVFLERSDCKSVVISNENKKEIMVYIDTQNKQGREFLAIIRDKFDEINSNSNVKEEIPLMLDKINVGYVEYSYVIALEKSNRQNITHPVDTKDGFFDFKIASLLDGYVKSNKKIFDYDKLKEDLIEISLIETESRQAIFSEEENATNDRFKNALLHRGYHCADQSRGGESQSSKNVGERDIVIRNKQSGITETVIEAFQLKKYNSTVIKNHYKKLISNYDTTGNKINFILVYSKEKNFNDLWSKYKSNFNDFNEEEQNKINIKVGSSTENNMTICHLFVNFYSPSKINTKKETS